MLFTTTVYNSTLLPPPLSPSLPILSPSLFPPSLSPSLLLSPSSKQATTQAATSTPTSTANKEKPPPKIMMEQWKALQEAATKKP